MAESGNVPKHLWIVGVVGLLWSAMGAFDYVMTQTRNEGYMEAFTPEQLEFFYTFPAWVTFFWAIAVWGGVVGCVLLLMRSKHAAPIFLASLVALAITAVHNFGLSNGMEVMGDAFSLIFTAVIIIVSVALFLYSKEMVKQGVLE